MGERSTVSGHIQESYYVPDNLVDELLRSNVDVITALPAVFMSERVESSPRTGPGQNWLTADMFIFSEAGQQIGSQRWPSFRGRTIFFSATYSKLWIEWSDWLAEFETLLGRLFWEHATVTMINEAMPDFHCVWRANTLELPGDGSLPAPPGWYRFEGPRSLDDIPPFQETLPSADDQSE